MYRWYVINTYSGHENKVKHNLEHRVETMGQGHRVRSVIVGAYLWGADQILRPFVRDVLLGQ